MTDTIPCVSQAGLPVPHVLTAGEFVQEHLGRYLCGFLCGPRDDPSKQEEIQNCLKARILRNHREVMMRDVAEADLLACLPCCFLYVSKKLPPVDTIAL